MSIRSFAQLFPKKYPDLPQRRHKCATFRLECASIFTEEIAVEYEVNLPSGGIWEINPGRTPQQIKDERTKYRIIWIAFCVGMFSYAAQCIFWAGFVHAAGERSVNLTESLLSGCRMFTDA